MSLTSDRKHKHKRWSAYHYNAVAKEIRELFPPNNGYASPKTRKEYMATRATLTTLALSFARRFKADWEEAEEGYAFDPLKFLDACSSDPEAFPLSEFWED